MSDFSSIAMALLAIAMLFVLVPMLRKQRAAGASLDVETVYKNRLAELGKEHERGELDDSSLQQQKLELASAWQTEQKNHQAAASQGGGLWLILALVIVPVSAMLVYWQIGGWPQSAGIQQAKDEQAQINQMVTQLERKLAAKPTNVDGWIMLARSHSVLKNWHKAANAWAQAYTQQGGTNTALLTDYAETLAQYEEQGLQGPARQLFEAALAQAPNNNKALWYAGLAAMEAEEPKVALKHWLRLLNNDPPPVVKQALQQQIARAQEQVGDIDTSSAPVSATTAANNAVPDTAANTAADSAAKAAFIDVSVNIAAELQGQYQPSHTVFIYAQPINARMPVAIVKTIADKLPGTFRLDDSTAMNPNVVLSGFEQVNVTARITASGNAIPKTGDLVGMAQVDVATGQLNIVIDKVK